MAETRSHDDLVRILAAIQADLKIAGSVLRDNDHAISIEVRGEERMAEFGILDLNQPFLRCDIRYGRTFIDEDSTRDELDELFREFADVCTSYVVHGADIHSGLRRSRLTVSVAGKPVVLWRY